MITLLPMKVGQTPCQLIFEVYLHLLQLSRLFLLLLHDLGQIRPQVAFAAVSSTVDPKLVCVQLPLSQKVFRLVLYLFVLFRYFV